MGNIQIKDVPPELHDELRRRAAVRGRTLRDYVLQLLQEHVSYQLQDEWLEEMMALEPLDPGGKSSAEIIRAVREERGAEILRRVGVDPDVDR
ncbi:MAG: hypothetical protein ITG02_11235 [Patulibacter sp.]|nr:hypothetical protein [Patulibacter sp.]